MVEELEAEIRCGDSVGEKCVAVCSEAKEGKVKFLVGEFSGCDLVEEREEEDVEKNLGR